MGTGRVRYLVGESVTGLQGGRRDGDDRRKGGCRRREKKREIDGISEDGRAWSSQADYVGLGGVVCRSAVYCTARRTQRWSTTSIGSVGKRCGQQGEGGVRENVVAGIIVWWCVMTRQRESRACRQRTGRASVKHTQLSNTYRLNCSLD